MIVLGINISHGARASLMINGQIVFCFQEERFNKIKNFVEYLKISIDKCIEFVKEKKFLENQSKGIIKKI